MAWIHDEIGRATGLPRELGGIPLDEIGATGWGVRHATEVALEFCNLGIKGTRMVIQGFGAVGMHAAKFLGEQGANLVGVADSRGSIANPKGIDIDALIGLVKSGKSVIEYEDGEKQNQDALIDIECEIWIPPKRCRAEVPLQHGVVLLHWWPPQEQLAYHKQWPSACRHPLTTHHHP